MLRRFEVRNIVLIDQLAIDFAPGFCVLTGETGAGKSILLDAIGLLRGDRADAGLVRKGAEQAVVSATLDVPRGHPVRGFLEEQGLAAEDDLVLRRVLGMDGRSRAFINDQSVSVGLLREIGTMLIDLHGQFDTAGLFAPAQHRDMLDHFAGLIQDRDAVQGAWNTVQSSRSRRDTAVQDAAAAIREQETLKAERDLLHDLDPQEDEEEKLIARKVFLSARVQITEGLSQASACLSGEGGADTKIAQAARALDKLRPKLTASETWITALDSALSDIRETTAAIDSMLFDTGEGSESLEEIEDRLYELRSAARRMGCAVANLPAKLAETEKRLQLIDDTGSGLVRFEKDVAQAEDAYARAARTLGEKRRIAAEKLARAVMKELPPLKLEKAKFVVAVESAEPGPAGADTVRFLVAANPGAEPGPIDKVASGGELSRLMLALKVVMAEKSDTHVCMVFDEVDSGIGGAVAAAVGERLARLSATRQVLSVTHAPQVAALAAQHWIVKKSLQGKVVTTTVEQLGAVKERREEIARMLSGEHVTNEARAAADRLLEVRAA